MKGQATTGRVSVLVAVVQQMAALVAKAVDAAVGGLR